MTTKWLRLPFFADRYPSIINTLHRKNPRGDWLPSDALRALSCPSTVEETKVLILGQDPYPTPGHANGFAFSVNRNVHPLPKSLQNIFKELVNDLGVPSPPHGDLSSWARQGVLLLNTCLTVSPFQANSHRGLGWEELAEQVVKTLSNQTTRRVFILWGKQAQTYEPLIDSSKHLVIKSPHPSPLSASYGFFGSKPFSRANEYLAEPINWGLHESGNLAAPRPSPTITLEDL